jgi:hypothetical protein
MLFCKIKFNLLSEYSLTLRAHEKNAIWKKYQYIKPR